MKMAEMTTKYLEYYINLVDKAAAGFERSDSQFYKNLYCGLEKAMAPHSSTLAWKIPWMEEPGRLFMGSLRVGHD